MKEVAKNEGRPKKYTEEYVNKVFNDYILNNVDEKITPTKLQKWSALDKWEDYSIGEIPRYIWYKTGMRTKIDEYNKIPYAILDTSAIELPTPFNMKKIVENFWGNKKMLLAQLEAFEKRANIALTIATEAKNIKNELEKLKLENNKNLTIIEEQKEKIKFYKDQVVFYQNQYDELIVDSNSLRKRQEKGISHNVLSVKYKAKKYVESEINIDKLIETVTPGDIYTNSEEQKLKNEQVEDDTVVDDFLNL